MGLFSRKKIDTNRLFSTEEMIKLLGQKEYQNYTSETIETPNGLRHRLMTIAESRQKEQEIRKRQLIMDNGFKDRITGSGEYRNLNTTPMYNNYQNAKGYNRSAWSR